MPRCRGGRQRSRGGSMRSEGDRGRSFRTPESWQRQVNEGLMPTRVLESAGGPRDKSSEGPHARSGVGRRDAWIHSGSRVEKAITGASYGWRAGPTFAERESRAQDETWWTFGDMFVSTFVAAAFVWIVVKCVHSCQRWHQKTPRAVGVNDKNEKRDLLLEVHKFPSGTPPGNDSLLRLDFSPVVPPPPLPPFPDFGALWEDWWWCGALPSWVW